MSQTTPAHFVGSVNLIATQVFWTLLVLLVAVIAVSGPVLTSDGPSHLAMAHFMLRAGDAAWPALNQLYELNLTPSPNALGHLIMAGLMLFFPPLVTEQIIQVLCLVSLLLAARLTCGRLAPNSGWIALFFFPVALQRIFFMGLYNYCLSLTGSLLCIWAYLRLRERPSIARTVSLTAMLIGTLACQASGWMEAALAVGTLAMVETLLRLRAGERPMAILRLPLATMVSLAPVTLLFALFALLAPGDRHVTYGPTVFGRLLEVFRGDAFAPIGRSTALVSLVMGLTLIVLALVGGVALARAPTEANPDARRLRLSIGMLPLSFLGLLLIMPDEAGGGWTHTWRAQVFPYVGIALACAVVPCHHLIRKCAIAIASIGGLVMIAMTLWVQAWAAPAAAREFNEADSWIGPHCTLATVLTQFKLDPANTARLFYHPMFHIASRFELRSDRPVLFSYNARLPIYPVVYRHAADPQRLLYGWQTSQRDTRVYKIDIAGFEASSGMTVDYVLLWDFPNPDQPGPYHDIRAELADARYSLAHRSSGGRMEFYQRTGSGGCAKP